MSLSLQQILSLQFRSFSNLFLVEHFFCKPTQQIVYRNWRKFNPECYVAVLNFSKENPPADVDSAWNNYLATEETVLDTLIPHKT